MSYVVRLADANHVPPATVLHYLGKFFSAGPARRDLHGRRLFLNDLATHRLAVAADRPAQDLARALPELRIPRAPGVALPNDIPGLRWRGSFSVTLLACQYCSARGGVRSPVHVHRPARWELLCRRHHIWPDERHTAIGVLPGVISALRRYRVLRRQHGTDHPALRTAEAILTHWFNFGRPLYRTLQARWEQRLHTIGSTLPTASTASADLVMLPELAALARCIVAGHGPFNVSRHNILKKACTAVGLRGSWELHLQDPLRSWAWPTASPPPRGGHFRL